MGENIGASEAAIPAARASSSIGIVDLKKLVIIGVVIFGILNSHSEDERTLEFVSAYGRVCSLCTLVFSLFVGVEIRLKHQFILKLVPRITSELGEVSVGVRVRVARVMVKVRIR